MTSPTESDRGSYENLLREELELWTDAMLAVDQTLQHLASKGETDGAKVQLMRRRRQRCLENIRELRTVLGLWQ